MNGVELAVVAAGEADLETIAALVNRAFLTHALMRGDRTDAGGLLEESGEGGRFILAKAGETIVGSAMVRPVNATDVHDGYAPPATALYYGLAGVDTRQMKRGIGRLLLCEAERIGREHAHTHIALNTLYEFDLVPYYIRQGYAPVFEERFEADHWGLPEPHRVCYLEKKL